MSWRETNSRGKRGEDFFWNFGALNGMEMLKRYTTKEEQKTLGDFRVCMAGGEMNVDAKVEHLHTPNFPVETSQCVKLKSPGWFFALTDCQEIWYAQVEDNVPLTPYGFKFHCIYRVSYARVYDIWMERADDWKEQTVVEGWGTTKILLAPLDELVRKGAAVLWWGFTFDEWKRRQ